MLVTDAKQRKETPIYSGVLKYFPLALAEIARVSKAGNDQHNPGQPLHWDKSKSTDHGDCLIRHQLDAGSMDTDGQRHSAKVAWRALAQLEMELESEQRTEQPQQVIWVVCNTCQQAYDGNLPCCPYDHLTRLKSERCVDDQDHHWKYQTSTHKGWCLICGKVYSK